MIKLRRIKFKNFLTYENLNYKFKSGLTTVRGKNKSGKSIIFSSIGEIAFDSTPMVATSGRLKTLFSKKKFSLDLDVTAGDSKYTIGKFRENGTSNRLRIIENNVDQKYRTLKEGKSRIGEIFPISMNKFYMVNYLTFIRPNPLLLGTPTQKFDVFQDLLSSTIYDDIFKYFKKEWDKVRENTTKLSVYQTELADYKLDNLDLKEIKNDIKRLMTRLDFLNTSFKKLKKERDNIRIYLTVSESLTTDLDIRELQKKIKVTEDKIKKYEKLYDKVLKQRELAERNKEIARTRSRLEKELAGLGDGKQDYSEIVKGLDKIVIPLLEKGVKHARIRQQLSKKLDDYQTDSQWDAKTYKKHHSHASHASQVLKRIKKIEGHKNCPICSRPISKKEYVKTVNKFSKEMKEHISIMRDMKKARIKNKIETHLARLVDVDVDNSDLEKINRAMRYMEKQTKKFSRKREIREQLDNLPKIDTSIKHTTDPEKVRSRIKKLNAALNSYQEDVKLREKLAELDLPYTDIKETKKKFNQLNEKIARLEQNVDQANERLNGLKTDFKVGKVSIAKYRDLKAKVSEIENNIGDGNIIQGLLTAYGPRGLRTLHAQSMINIFCERLNDATQYVYDEEYKFHIEMKDNRVAILAERNGDIGDVSSFSGAEARCFQLVCMPATLGFIPPSERLDTIILDEMNSNMDPDMEYIFANSYVKMVGQLFDKVIVISPEDESKFYVPGVNHTIEVIKENKKSRIIETSL